METPEETSIYCAFDCTWLNFTLKWLFIVIVPMKMVYVRTIYMCDMCHIHELWLFSSFNLFVWLNVIGKFIMLLTIAQQSTTAAATHACVKSDNDDFSKRKPIQSIQFEFLNIIESESNNNLVTCVSVHVYNQLIWLLNWFHIHSPSPYRSFCRGENKWQLMTIFYRFYGK